MRPAPGPRLLEARQEWLELEAWPFVALHVRLGTVARPGDEGRVPTDPHVWEVVGRPCSTVPNPVHFEALKLGVMTRTNIHTVTYKCIHIFHDISTSYIRICSTQYMFQL